MSKIQKSTKKTRNPVLRAILIIIAIVILVLPIDFIPDVAPIVGWIDDLIAVSYLISELIRTIKNKKN